MLTKQDVEKAVRAQCDSLAQLKTSPDDCEKAAEIMGWLAGYTTAAREAGIITDGDHMVYYNNKIRASNACGGSYTYLVVATDDVDDVDDVDDYAERHQELDHEEATAARRRG